DLYSSLAHACVCCGHMSTKSTSVCVCVLEMSSAHWEIMHMFSSFLRDEPPSTSSYCVSASASAPGLEK
ncbi:hypothetical protein ZWY2020_037149, partial [Hordeum vulgare]